MPPEISVIILLSCWGENEKRSVESVLAQEIPPGEMEIIAIISDLNREMNNFLEGNNITSVFSREKGLGAMAATGIEKSNAPVVTFLEGGDLYTPDRVKQSAELINEDSRNMYHHSSIEPISDEESSAPINFINIDYDLYTNQDDVSYAYPHVMRANAARHLSAITCRKSALEDYLGVIRNIHTCVDIALLAVCLQYGGRFMFDTSKRTKCRIGLTDDRSEESLKRLIGQEIEFHEGRLKDMETIERSLTFQMPRDVARGEMIYSRIALSFLSDDKERKLSAATKLHYFTVGMFEHYKEFRRWMRSSLVDMLSPGHAKRKFLAKLAKEPWNMRM